MRQLFFIALICLLGSVGAAKAAAFDNTAYYPGTSIKDITFPNGESEKTSRGISPIPASAPECIKRAWVVTTNVQRYLAIGFSSADNQRLIALRREDAAPKEDSTTLLEKFIAAVDCANYKAGIIKEPAPAVVVAPASPAAPASTPTPAPEVTAPPTVTEQPAPATIPPRRRGDRTPAPLPKTETLTLP